MKMLSRQTRLRVFGDRGLVNGFRTGISLHCHTQHSKEILDFIPHYASLIPILGGQFFTEMERYRENTGRDMDFSRAYWTPPLSARNVYDLESQQIENTLDARAYVSITDHDTIESALLLHSMDSYKEIPISVEWTVPYGEAYVHVGVHNLPADESAQLMNELREYTSSRAARAARLAELFTHLNEIDSVLVVLNHPLWDIELIGQERHMKLVSAFLAEHGRWIHALETNGFRSWQENKGAARLAEELGFPLVSGGDRHGCSANTMLNLTNATTFDEFVSEVRRDGRSEILLMPPYKENLTLRMLEAVNDVLRYYPQHPLGRKHWTERIFMRHEDGIDRPLALQWHAGVPAWIKLPLWVLRVLGSRRFRPAMRLVLSREDVAEGAWL